MTAPLSAAQILRAAAEIVERPGAWTQGAPARDDDGVDVDPPNPLAVCWCMTGAITLAAGESSRDSIDLALIALSGTMPSDGYTDPSFVVQHWNDLPGRTEQEVAQRLRRAADTLDPPGAA